MTWEINEQEFETVSGLPFQKRYSHFIKKVAGYEELWSLKNEDGWVLAGDDDGNEVIPVWPHARYAEACTDGSWRGYSPARIDLYDWMERWLPGIAEDARLVTVFPTPSDKGAVVPPDRLMEDLDAEMDSYE